MPDWASFTGSASPATQQGGSGSGPQANTGQTPAPPGNSGGQGANNLAGSIGGSGGGSGAGSGSPGNFGQPLLPWDMPYQGQFTAPMSPYQTNALQGYSNFVQGGQGLNPANNYLNSELSGQYDNLSSNPYLQQIQSGMQGMKNYNDQQALANIGSSMALGGNALSGARLGAQNDYMTNSNNQFESTIGQLMNQDYMNERNLQNQAPGQLANLAGQAGAGYAQLMGMGSVPQQTQQNDLNAQYQDFLRQSGNMQGSYMYPDQAAESLLANGGYKGQYQPLYGTSTAGQIAGALGSSNIDWGSLLQQLGIGGDTSGTGQDGVRLGYDGPTPAASGPGNYYNANWYQNALLNEQQQRAQASQNQANGPNTTLASILPLLLSILAPKKSGGGMGAGGGGGKSTPPGSVPTGSPGGGTPAGSTYAQPIGPGLQGTPGASPDMFNDPQSPYFNDPFLDPNNFAGNYSNQTAFGTDNPNMQGPYMPTTQDQFGSNNPDMQGPYMPSDGGFDTPDSGE